VNNGAVATSIGEIHFCTSTATCKEAGKGAGKKYTKKNDGLKE
jgi:hypothetical protein